MKEIDKVFKALADPSRRELLDRLNERNGQTLTELCEGLAMARQSVTQHLGVLEGANLISVQWQGREKLHYFNPVPIHEIYQRWIRKFEQPRLDALRKLKTKLERK
jgi:DNA-binding transcriptional ArsR family regulator